MDLLKSTYFSAQYIKNIPIRPRILINGWRDTKKAVNTQVLTTYTYSNPI